MGRNIVVSEATGQHIEDFPVEIVERKGIGHPDSLCDGIAERISRDYTISTGKSSMCCPVASDTTILRPIRFSVSFLPCGHDLKMKLLFASPCQDF